MGLCLLDGNFFHPVKLFNKVVSENLNNVLVSSFHIYSYIILILVNQIQNDNVAEKCWFSCNLLEQLPVTCMFFCRFLLKLSILVMFEGQLTLQHDTQHILLNSKVLVKDPKELKYTVAVVKWPCFSSYPISLLLQLFIQHPNIKIWRWTLLLNRISPCFTLSHLWLEAEWTNCRPHVANGPIIFFCSLNSNTKNHFHYRDT